MEIRPAETRARRLSIPETIDRFRKSRRDSEIRAAKRPPLAQLYAVAALLPAPRIRKDETMTTQTRLIRLSAAALLGLSAVSAGMLPAQADQAPAKKQVELDHTATGSVRLAGKSCDPNDPRADIVCKVTRGEPDARYPEAPAYPAFGF